jgi:hypothetical protein
MPDTWNDGPGGASFEGYFVEFAPAATPALPAPGTVAILAMGLAGPGLRRKRA